MSLRRTLGTMANKIVHDAKNKEFYAMLNDKKGIALYFPVFSIQFGI